MGPLIPRMSESHALFLSLKPLTEPHISRARVDLTPHHDVVATPSKVKRLSPVDIDGRRLPFADSEHTPSSSASSTGEEVDDVDMCFKKIKVDKILHG
ncbi:uncharacterized protein G2W53_042425 [Senna tora]|uniref:Uncharacterized protein n=1 Tax=Senna tora TaxID=362788 RepID=A0A834W3W1_9FABA|nr:uncharacterized protein G2W53_042425 [Senna tora]